MNLTTVLKTKFEKVSHIYTICKTSNANEFAIGGYDGMYFGTVEPGHVSITTEALLMQKTIKSIREIAPNRFLVGLDHYPAYVIVDRFALSGSEILREVQSSEVKTRCTYIQAIGSEHPYYIGRTSNSVDLINVQSGKSRALVITELTDRLFYDSAVLQENYGNLFRIFYIEEETQSNIGNY